MYYGQPYHYTWSTDSSNIDPDLFAFPDEDPQEKIGEKTPEQMINARRQELLRGWDSYEQKPSDQKPMLSEDKVSRDPFAWMFGAETAAHSHRIMYRADKGDIDAVVGGKDAVIVHQLEKMLELS